MNKIKIYNLFKVFLVLLAFYSVSLCDDAKCVVFITNTAYIPDSVINKIVLSKRFCMTVPVLAKTTIPSNLQEAIASGKIELAHSLNPEPVFSIFLDLENNKKTNASRVLENYISKSFTSFEQNINNRFGLFLKFAEVSNDMLYYFSNLGFMWVNVDNLKENLFGAYKVNGIIVFSLYKDFPNNQEDIIRWISKKDQNVVPVLLTRDHLQNLDFMNYLIYTLDNNQDIKPIVPMYASKFCKFSKLEKNQIFQYWQVDFNLKAKLSYTINLMDSYVSANNFNERIYSNIQDEFIYLIRYDILKNYNSSRDSAKQFDAAYDNISRLLGSYSNSVNANNTYEGDQKKQSSYVKQVQIKQILNGVHIENEGLLRIIKVLSQNESIQVSFSLDSLVSSKIAFIDFYIALNNVEGMGVSSFIDGLSGFFTNGPGWQYALRIYKDKAILYKYSVNGAARVTTLDVKNNMLHIPKRYLRGNTLNWGYQAIIVENKDNRMCITDFLNQSDTPKESIIAITPFEVSMVRYKPETEKY